MPVTPRKSQSRIAEQKSLLDSSFGQNRNANGQGGNNGGVFLLQRIAESEVAASFFTKNRLLCQVPLFIFMIIMILGGVAIAVGLLLGLQERDLGDQISGLTSLSSTRTQLLAHEAERMLSIGATAASLFTLLGNGTVSLSQYNSFCNNNRLSSVYISDVSYMPLVLNASRPAFEANIRNLYASTIDAYKGFYVWALYASGAAYPSDADMYLPVTYYYPPETAKGTVGFDMLSDKVRRASMFQARDGKQPVVTSPFLVGRQAGATKYVGGYIITPIFDEHSSWLGITRVKFSFSKLVQFVFSDVLQQLDVSIYDTTDLSNPIFVNSTIHDTTLTQQINTTQLSLIFDTAAQTRLWTYLQQLEGNVRGSSVRQHLIFGQRNLTAYYTVTDTYLATFQPSVARRWVLFAVVLVVAIIGVLLLFCASLGVRLGGNIIKMLQRKLAELRQTKTAMNNLIEQLSQEEERTRVTMSVMPLAVALCDVNGNIIFANEMFLQTLHYAEQEITSGTMPAQKLLPQLDIKALMEKRPKKFIVTTIVQSAFKVEESNLVSITFMNHGNNGKASAFHAIATSSASSAPAAATAAPAGAGGQSGGKKFVADFIITIDHRFSHESINMSTLQTQLNSVGAADDTATSASDGDTSPRGSRENNDRMFESMFTHDTALMHAFNDFCTREHSEEGLAFWRAVREYRRMPDTFTRVKRQQDIYLEFLHEMALSPLNLPQGNQSVTRELEKVKKFLGQPEVFDVILGLVLEDLRHDLFERFMYIHRGGVPASMPKASSEVSLNIQTPIASHEVPSTSTYSVLLSPVSTSTPEPGADIQLKDMTPETNV